MSRRVLFWIRRYRPSELTGTVTAFLAAWGAFAATGSLLVAAVAGTIGENIGFYGVATARNFLEQWREATPMRGRRARRSFVRTAWLTAVEFGPAELLDTLLIRPGLLYLAPLVIGIPAVGWVVGKVLADVLFYLLAAVGHLLGRRMLSRRPIDDTVIEAEVRAARIRQLARTLDRVDLDALITRHGTPFMLLEPQRVAEQYARLRAALPFVRLHYAVKALPHPAVLDTIAALGGCFDVASDAEIDLLASRGIRTNRMIHTHPVKSPAEITRAYVLGIRTFVIDSAGELAKFRGVPADVSLLVRLGYRNPAAKSDLSSKFGVSHAEADALMAQAAAQGSRIAGFSFHVGSQLDSVAAFRTAVGQTLDLMGRLEARWAVKFGILDIGGGFPASYRRDVATIEQIGEAIGPMLEPFIPRLTVIAEPGRILVADAATVVTRVVGTRVREAERWCFVDDGVYGSFSNVATEAVHPVLVARSELDGTAPALVPTTVAGPTCDSADVLARSYPLPALREGDTLLSPTMGAYTAVTATEFNGRRRAPIVVIDRVAPEAVRPETERVLATVAS
ncbi:hypothetical protein [Lacisediminihabitans sp.]|uniref:hypothetical protein n=1 Tax=Lacisediminihabitans sp. TaxID=2787631 RepID=UPI00374CAFF1